MKILITGGATREPIDEVRFVTNFSSGLTAATLVDEFIKAGDEVTYLRGQDSIAPQSKCKMNFFESFSDLDSQLKKVLETEKFDAIIHLAAVSDYTPTELRWGGEGRSLPTSGKLSSIPQEFEVKFKRNFKIVERLKSYSKQATPTVVAFKLTNTKDENERKEAIEKLAQHDDIDYVVHNDLSEINSGGQFHLARIFKRSSLLFKTETKLELAKKLRQALKERL